MEQSCNRASNIFVVRTQNTGVHTQKQERPDSTSALFPESVSVYQYTLFPPHLQAMQRWTAHGIMVKRNTLSEPGLRGGLSTAWANCHLESSACHLLIFEVMAFVHPDDSSQALPGSRTVIALKPMPQHYPLTYLSISHAAVPPPLRVPP